MHHSLPAHSALQPCIANQTRYKSSGRVLLQLGCFGCCLAVQAIGVSMSHGTAAKTGLQILTGLEYVRLLGINGIHTKRRGQRGLHQMQGCH